MTAFDRDQALGQIRELMQEFAISLDEIELEPGHGDPPDRASQTIVRVLTYIGGTLIFAGIATFIALQWDAMNALARVIVTLGSGVSFFVLAILARADSRYHAAAMPLFLTAAILQPIGLLVAFAEFGGGGDERVAGLITAGVLGAQYLTSSIKWRLTTLVFVAAFFLSGFWALLLDLMDLGHEPIALSLGAAWLGAAHALRTTTHRLTSPLLYFAGCWAFLFGWWELVSDTAFEATFLLLACGFVYLGVWAKSRALNFTATLAILGYTAYFTGKNFADSVGWPIALIIIGAAMIAISLTALRIDRKYLRQKAD